MLNILILGYDKKDAIRGLRNSAPVVTLLGRYSELFRRPEFTSRSPVAEVRFQNADGSRLSLEWLQDHSALSGIAIVVHDQIQVAIISRKPNQ